MSQKRAPSSAVESLTESPELNFNSLSLNDVVVAGHQSIDLSQGSDQSGSCLAPENQVNDLGASNVNGLHSTLQKEGTSGFNGIPGLTGNLTSDDDNSNQGQSLSSGNANDNRVVAEPALSVGSSSNNINHPVAVSSIFRQQNVISSGSNFSNPGLSGLRKESLGGSRQIFEAGSSSGSEQEEDILSNNLPADLYVSSSLELPMSPDLHANFDTLPHPSTNIHPQRPQGNFNTGREFRSPQNSMNFNSLAMGNSPLHFESNPSQSQMPQLPLTINPNLRAGTSTERRQLFDQQDLANHPQDRSVAGGSYGAYHQTRHDSGFQQLPTQPLGHPSTNQAGRQQSALGYPPLHPPHWNGPGSGVGNFGFPPPNPASSGHLSLFDAVVQSGQAQFLDPLLSPSGNEGPRTLQELSDHIERNHRTLIELRDRTLSEELQVMRDAHPIPPLQDQELQVMRDAHPIPPLQDEELQVMRDAHPIPPLQDQPMSQDPRDIVHHNANPPPGETLMPNLLTRARFDIDNMSYEELIILREQMGKFRAGLRENFMKHLNRRDYECVTRDSSSDAETCCICLEDYVHGEGIGNLNCGHEFHCECIEQWILVKNTCPLCTSKGLGD